MKKLFTIITFLFFFLFQCAPIISAHPGNTAADGCHYCRTNCDKWGEVEGARHCHGGGSTSTTTITGTQQQYIAPTKAPVSIPTPKPTVLLSPIPTPSPRISPSPANIPEPSPTEDLSQFVISTEAVDQNENKSDELSDDDLATGVVVAGVLGFGGYQWLKGRRKSNVITTKQE